MRGLTPVEERQTRLLAAASFLGNLAQADPMDRSEAMGYESITGAMEAAKAHSDAYWPDYIVALPADEDGEEG